MDGAAARLSLRLDELASSLHRAGADPQAAAKVLELAAAATLKAVELELRLADRNRPRAHRAPASPLDAAPLRAAA